MRSKLRKLQRHADRRRCCLSENGLNPVVHSLSDAGLALHDGNGGPGYTGLVMLATPVKGERVFAGSSRTRLTFLEPASTSALGPRALLHFLERGGDVLWATPASQPVPEAWRDFAQEFDVELAGDGSRVQDLSQCATNPQPLAFAQDPGLPSVLRFTAEAVLHNGSSHVLGHHPRLVSILHASPSSFLADSRGVMAEDADAAAGTSLSLVSAFQTAKNSRITFASDAGMLSDGALSAKCVARDNSPWTRPLTSSAVAPTSLPAASCAGLWASPASSV